MVRCQGSGNTPNPKFQTPNKSQTPNSKHRINRARRSLEFGNWSFFGDWSLVVGAFIHISAPPSDRRAPHGGRAANTPKGRWPAAGGKRGQTWRDQSA